MRLHTLTLRGVGPFRDAFTVDFDADGHKLLLIDGDTGSGKSTIIDAIVFALYGDPADTTAKDRMVSDFLPTRFAKADRPFVELTFTVDRGTFRVRREPSYDYINRNDKPATQNTALRLERLPNEVSASAELVSTSVAEGSTELRSLLQLDRGQFMATIVLAQGQFANFLRAGDEERTKILAQVFQTSLYESVDRRLQELDRKARQLRDTSAEALGREAARFRDAAQLDLTDEEWRDRVQANPTEAVADAEHRVAALKDAAAAALSAKEAADAAATAAEAAMHAAQDAAKKVVDKAALLAEQARLRDAAPRVAELRRRLEQHARATSIQPSRDSRQDCAKEYAATAEALQASRSRLTPADAAALLAAGTTEASEERAQQRVSELTSDVARLARVVQLEDGLSQRHSDLSAADARIAELGGDLAAIDKQAAALPQLIEDLTRQVDSLRTQAADAEHRGRALDQANEGLAAAEREAVAAAAEAAARTALATASQQLAAATRTAHEVERAFHANLAGILVTTLVAGEPCGVCGSTEHPSPAAPADDAASKDAVDAARADVERHRLALDRAKTVLGTVTSQRAAAAAIAKGRPPADWQGEATAAGTALARAQEAATAATAAEAELEAGRTRLAELQQASKALALDIATKTTQRDAVAQQLADDEREVAEARGSAASVRELSEELQRRRSHLEDWLRWWAEHQRAASALTTAQQSFDHALAASGLATESALDEALMSESERQAAEESVAGHDKDTSAVDARLADLSDVDASERIDLAAPRAAAAEAAAARASTVAAHQAAQQSSGDAAKRLIDLRKAAAALQAAQSAARPVLRMAAIVHGGGDNTFHVPLSRYVILRRFENVLEAANERLQTMSDGRYRLVPDVTAKDGRKATRGLGLRVFDERTEQRRDVRTLSGGETFYTSLALALGLADVVQAEAGGVQLGTLFVDEGFGSLDPETLDAVMDVLTGLTQGDRMVGVISHVTEMKQSISNRIHVMRPDRDGPSIIVTPQ